MTSTNLYLYYLCYILGSRLITFNSLQFMIIMIFITVVYKKVFTITHTGTFDGRNIDLNVIHDYILQHDWNSVISALWTYQSVFDSFVININPNILEPKYMERFVRVSCVCCYGKRHIYRYIIELIV
jgi:hypothetical protein